METLEQSDTQQTLVDKDDRSRVSGSPGSFPVQIGVDLSSEVLVETSQDSAVEVRIVNKKDDVVTAESGLIETNISMEETDNNGVGVIAVAEIRTSECQKKMTEKKGKKKVDVDGKNKQVLGNSAGKIKGKITEVAESGSMGKSAGKEHQNESTEVDTEGEEDGEEVGDGQHTYSVGDLVWGKIKSHPWWPGQICSPSDASGTAAKYKRRNRLLVAYFGDGTFAWCYPSQLKPFQEEFDQLSEQSNSKGFTKAVHEAVNEIARRLDLEMACSCFEVKDKPMKPVIQNAGIKEGVAAPDGGIGDLSISRFEPAEFLQHLKYVGQVVSVNSMLDLLVLQRCLSSFYRAKGYDQLPEFHDPVGIIAPDDTSASGLSHKANDESQTADPTGSPEEAEWLTSAPGNGVGSTGITISRRWSGISDDKLFQSKKERSVAEILDKNINVKDDGTHRASFADEGTMSGKATVRTKNKRDNISIEGRIDVTEDLAISGKQTPASLSRKRNTGTKVGHENNSYEEGTVSTKTTVTPRKRRKNKKSESGNNEDAAEDNKTKEFEVGKATVTPRKRRKDKESEVGHSFVALENNIKESEDGKATVTPRKGRKKKEYEAGHSGIAVENNTKESEVGKAMVTPRKGRKKKESEIGNSDLAVENKSKEYEVAKTAATPKQEVKNKDYGVGNSDLAAENKLKESVVGKTTATPRTRIRRKNKEAEVGNNDVSLGDKNKESEAGKATTTPRKRRHGEGSEVGINDGVAEENKTKDFAVCKTTITPRKRRKNEGSEVGYNDGAAGMSYTKDSEVRMTVSSKQVTGSAARKKIQERNVGTDGAIVKEPTFSGKQVVRSRKRKKMKDFRVGSDKEAEQESSGKQTTESLERKENMGSDLAHDNGIVEEGSNGCKQAPSKMTKETKLTGPSVGGEKKDLNVDIDDFGADDRNKPGASSRERKKSKYLSPPYTNLSHRQKNMISTNDSKKETPSTSHERESVMRASGQLTIWPPIVKCSGEMFGTKLAKKSHLLSTVSGGLSPLKPNGSHKKTVFEENNTSAHEMLSDFRSAALDPLCLANKQSDDIIKSFFTKFRSSLYQNISDFMIYNDHLAGRGSRKKVSFDINHDLPWKDTNETCHPISEGESDTKKKKKKKDEVPRRSRSKHVNGIFGMQADPKGKSNGDISVAAFLLIFFVTGVSLPSKDELITTYSRFGALKESEIEVIEDSGCAQVAFARESDAKKAYQNSVKKSPFGTSVNSYRLRYLSAASRASVNAGDSHQNHHLTPSPMKGGNTQRVQSDPKSEVHEGPPLMLIKQNLEMTTSVLENSWAKLPLDVKAKLDGEIEVLLRKVDRIPHFFGNTILTCLQEECGIILANNGNKLTL